MRNFFAVNIFRPLEVGNNDKMIKDGTNNNSSRSIQQDVDTG